MGANRDLEELEAAADAAIDEEDDPVIEIVDVLEFDGVWIDEPPIAAALPGPEPTRAFAVMPESEPPVAFAEAFSTSDVPPAPDEDAFVALVGVMTRVANTLGASPQAADFLCALLGLERMGERSPGESAAAVLVAAKIVVPHGRGFARTPELGNQILAWQSLLRGQSDDFSACGSLTLDEWAASLVAHTLGEPARAARIRQELRAHGVAAFGLVTQAAA